MEVLDDDSLGSPTFTCTKCGGTMETMEVDEMPQTGEIIYKKFDEKEFEGDWLF